MVPGMEEPTGLVERRILEAMEEGLFDDLDGAGRPIPGLRRPYEPDWWVRKWAERQRALERAEALARRVENRLGAVWRLHTEGAVRAALPALDAEREAAGLEPLDEAEVLRTWRIIRTVGDPAGRGRPPPRRR